MTAALLGFAVSGLLPEGDPSKSLRRAMWLVVAASASAALSPAFAVLLAARAAQGVGVGFLIAGGLAGIARNHSAGSAGRLTGLMIAGTAIGGLLSRLIGYTALWLGWRVAFALGGVFALGLITFALRSVADLPAGTGAGQAARVSLERGTPVGLITAGLGILFVNIAVFDLLPYRLSAAPFHLPAALADLVYLAFIPAMVTANLAGRGIDRFGARRVVVLTTALGIGCLLVGLLPSLVAVALMATGSISAVVALHIGHSGAAAAQGRVAVGRYLTAYYVGGALAAPVMAAAYQDWGWTATVLSLCAVWAAVGLLAVFSPTSRWRPGSDPTAPPPGPIPAAP